VHAGSVHRADVATQLHEATLHVLQQRPAQPLLYFVRRFADAEARSASPYTRALLTLAGSSPESTAFMEQAALLFDTLSAQNPQATCAELVTSAQLRAVLSDAAQHLRCDAAAAEQRVASAPPRMPFQTFATLLVRGVRMLQAAPLHEAALMQSEERTAAVQGTAGGGDELPSFLLPSMLMCDVAALPAFERAAGGSPAKHTADLKAGPRSNSSATLSTARLTNTLASNADGKPQIRASDRTAATGGEAVPMMCSTGDAERSPARERVQSDSSRDVSFDHIAPNAEGA
jgi:uncharacterized protein YfaS (alpha-2-macroglobulin family)